MTEVIDFVEAVHLYPIKSCQEATVNGEVITELEAGPTGLRYGEVFDREWVVADPDNLFVSQRGWDSNQARKFREDRMLATVGCDIKDDHLKVSAPGHGEIVIPFELPETNQGLVRIFGPELPVLDEGPEAGEFFSDIVSRTVRMWRTNIMIPRMLAERYQRPGAVNRSAGADGRPISLASQASLDYLHDVAGLPRGTVPLINFRANIDIEGLELGPFGEDTIRRLQAGQIIAEVVKALPRCPMPNINQITGEDSQRLATKLLRYRMGWALGDDTSGKAEPYFAQSLNHVFIPGFKHTVKKGDEVVVLKSGEPNVVLKMT